MRSQTGTPMPTDNQVEDLYPNIAIPDDVLDPVESGLEGKRTLIDDLRDDEARGARSSGGAATRPTQTDDDLDYYGSGQDDGRSSGRGDDAVARELRETLNRQAEELAETKRSAKRSEAAAYRQQHESLGSDLARLEAAKQVCIAQNDLAGLDNMNRAISDTERRREAAAVSHDRLLQEAQAIRAQVTREPTLAERFAAEFGAKFDEKGHPLNDVARSMGTASQQLLDEGYDPSKPLHFKLLRNRLEKQDPKTFGRRGGNADDGSAQEPARRPNRGPQVAGTGEGGASRGQGGKTSTLAEVPKALLRGAAQIFDLNDPKVKNKLLSEYEKVMADIAATGKK